MAIMKEKTLCPKLFLSDGVIYKAIDSINWFYSFIGLIIICLLLLLRIFLDKSMVGTFDLAWVSTYSEIG